MVDAKINNFSASIKRLKKKSKKELEHKIPLRKKKKVKIKGQKKTIIIKTLKIKKAPGSSFCDFYDTGLFDAM